MPETEEKTPYVEFAKKIKEKYPDYADVDDRTLAERMVEKYPEYKDRVVFDTIEVKKKESTDFQSPSPLLSSAGASQSTAGAVGSSGNPDYFNGGNLPDNEKAKEPIVDSVRDIQEKAPDLLRAATTPVSTTAKDQNNYDPELQQKLRGNQAEEALMRGTAHLANSVLKTPAFIYDAAAAVTNNVINAPLNYLTGGRVGYMPSSADISKNMPEELKITKQIDEAIESSKKETYDKKYDKALNEYFFGEKPDYEKGFEALGLGVLENAPTMIALMFGNAAGATSTQMVGAGTAVFGADKMSQVEKENPDMPLLNQVGVSAGSGALEGIGESLFGLSKIGGLAKQVFMKDGAEAAAKIATEGFIKTYGKIIARYVGVGAEEVTSEMATQFAQNLNDIYSGLNPNLDMWAGVKDAGLLALGSSVSTAGPVAIMDVVKTKKAVKRAADIGALQQSLNDDLSSPEVSEEAKPVIAKKILDLNEESAALASKEKKAFEGLTPEGQQEVETLVGQSKKLADAANDPGISEETRDALTKDVNEVDDAIEKVYETSKKPSPEEQKAQDLEKEDNAAEADFLNTLNAEVGLDADQAARLTEIEKNVPQAVPQEKKSTRSVEDIEADITKNKNKWHGAEDGDKKAYIDYRINNDALLKELEEAKKQKTDGKETEKTDQAEVLKTPEAVATKPVESTIPEPVATAATTEPKETAKEPSAAKRPDWMTEVDERDLKAHQRGFSVDHVKSVQDATKTRIRNNKEIPSQFVQAIKNGEITQEEAVKVIESAGLKVPEDIISLKKVTDATTETIGPEKIEPGATKVDSDQEAPAKKTKSPKQDNKLIDEDPEEGEDDEDDVTKNSPEALTKLDNEIEAMKIADNKVMDQKFVGMIERAYKMRAEGKISKGVYGKFKRRVADVYKGKKNLKAEEMKIRSTALFEKIKEKLLGQGYKNMALSTGIPVTPKTVADLLDLTNAIVHKIIDAGAGAVSLYDATQKALSIVKKHPTYKKLVASKELDEKVFAEEVAKAKEPKKEKPENKKTTSKEAGIEGGEGERGSNDRIYDNKRFKEIADMVDPKLDIYNKVDQDKAISFVEAQLNKFADAGLLYDLALEINTKEGAKIFPESVTLMVGPILADKLQVMAEKEGNQMQKDALNKLAAKVWDAHREKATIIAQQLGLTSFLNSYMPKSKAGTKARVAEELSDSQDSYLTKEEKKQVEDLQKELSGQTDPGLAERVKKMVEEEINRIAESLKGKDWVKNVNSALDNLKIDLTDC